jgi:hypothetical protein
MSFRLFIYYCAVCGGCAAFVGWVLGRWVPVDHVVARAALQGMLLGTMVAFLLGLIDAMWNSGGQTLAVGSRALVALLIGCIGGFLGGGIGQIFYNFTQQWPLVGAVFLIIGWTITGLLIGAAIGVFDVLARIMQNEDTRGAQKKLFNGILGGTAGGILGGILVQVLVVALSIVFRGGSGGADPSFWDFLARPWTPSAAGFVALGMCIGLLIGLAQVFLKEAWLKVEKGFRAGRELILSKPLLTIGRAESCDIGLFGDPTVEKLHVRILQRGGQYLVEDQNTQSGTLVNGQRIYGATPLRTGDLIQIGRNTLSFGERAKRS